MWIAFAFGSALFAGLTAILAKCGIKNTDSNVATALRTIVVLIFSWIMVFVVGAQKGLADISGKTLLFLIFSGLSTGASWLCYFKALQLGDVNKVTPIDKSSTILTMLLAFILLREVLSLLKVAAMIAIGVGTYLMIQKKETEEKKQDGKWLIYAIGSAVFASLTSILGKVGIQDVNSNLGTAIRTIVVLIMAWEVVFMTGKQHTVKQISALYGIACFKPHGCALHPCRRFIHGYGFFKVGYVFAQQKSRHYFCGACHGQWHIFIFAVKNIAGIAVYYNRRFCGNIGCRNAQHAGKYYKT